MKKCTDNRFRMMLHQYELGVLGDADREQFELHLYSCDHCLEKVLAFQNAATLIRHDPSAQQAIREIAEESQSSARSDARRTASGKFWPKFLPTSLVAAAVLAALILQPWRGADNSMQEATASENRLIVMPFHDATDAADSSRLGEILSSLVTADISESRLIQVVPTERRYDLLKLLGRDGSSTTDFSLARQIAVRAGAVWMVTGRIIREDDNRIAVTGDLIDVSTGDTSATMQLSGETGDGLFEIADSLTVVLAHQLSLPVGDFLKNDRPVADVTTHSMAAYRHYREGVDMLNRMRVVEAQHSFQEAIALDSTFAMAYYQLSLLGDYVLIEKAAAYAQHATERERLYIKARAAYISQNFGETSRVLAELITKYPDEKEAFLWLGTAYHSQRMYDDAIVPYHRALQLDPLYALAYNQLAYTYERAGKADSAIWAVNEYVRLSPQDANAFDTQGDIYARLGRLDDAIHSLNKALKLTPDYLFALPKLGLVYLFIGDYDRADSIFARHASVNQAGGIADAGLYRAVIQVFRGQFASALNTLDEGIGQDTLQLKFPAMILVHQAKYVLKMMLLAEINDIDSAVNEFEQYQAFCRKRHPDMPVEMQHLFIESLVKNREIGRAKDLTTRLKSDLTAAGRALDSYWYAEGAVRFHAGNPGAAIEFFAKALTQRDNPGSRFMLARSYHEAGRPNEAIAEYKRVLATYTYAGAFYCLNHIKSHYYLGRAYEAIENTDAAIARYEIFINLWGECDEELPMVSDARERLTGLKTGI